MKIVIDLPKETYKRFIDEWTGTTDVLHAVRHGTPLPKGHGAIKDVSQIEIPMCEDRAYEKWVQVAINSAPTIIEADRGE